MKTTRLAAAAAAACSPLVLSLLALPAHAQAQPAADAPVESIVIQGSFLNAGAQSALKLDAAVRDTPFSVSSYSDSFMKAIETANLADMYAYMTGIKRAGGTGYDVVIRGMKSQAADRNSILVDGLPGLSGRFGSPPTASIEHMEVVKGPMSVLYGQAQPGGFINIITKKPKASYDTELNVKASGYIGHGLSLADANGYEVSVDTTGPFDAKKKFLYRFIADTANRDGFRTAAYERPLLLTPSITWNVDDSTLLTVQYEYRNATTSYDNGLVLPNNEFARLAKVDIKTRYQEPTDYQWEKGRSWSFSGEHTFANDIKWNASFRTVKTQDFAKGLQTLATGAASANPVTNETNLTTIQRRALVQWNHRSYNFADTSLAIPFKTGTVEHKVLAGVNGGRETSDFDRLQFFNRGTCPATATAACFDVNLYNPVYGIQQPAAAPPTQYATVDASQHRVSASSSVGAYVSDLITFSEQWKATLGLRRAKEKQYVEERRIVGVPSRGKVSDSTLPMAGLLYQPTKEYTIYGSYSTSFSLGNVNAQDPFGNNNFKPEKAKQIEFGVKGEDLLNGKLTGTLGVFRIDKRDALYTTACISPGLAACSAQVGGERSEGVELEANLRPLENWQISANYSYVDASVTSSNIPAQVGAELTNVARNSASIWSRYDFATGALKGFGIGLGLTYTSDRPGPLPTGPSTALTPNTFTLPSYSLVDLGLYYTVDKYAFNLKIGNVTDKTYYESSGFTGNTAIQAGAPRNVTLSMRVHF